jgi:phosphotransferase system enzyme I (PtsI)
MSSEIRYSNLNSVFEGIVIGPVIKFLREIEENYIPKKEFSTPKEVEKELQRIQGTSEKLIENEEKYINKGGLSKEIENISRSYITLINDLTGHIKKEIQENSINAEYAVTRVIDNFSQRLQKMDDDYLKERVHDLQTIQKRFLAHLMEKNISDLQTFTNTRKHNDSYILVSDEIMPSDFSIIKEGEIAGIIHGKGGKTSHVAIIARSMEIPTIVGAEKIINYMKDRDLVILDAYDGTVYVNPEFSTLQDYQEKKKKKEKNYKDLIQKTKSLPAITTDNLRINVMANVEVDSDMEKLQYYGAEGIGLYRTEFLFIEDEETKVPLSALMDEEKQFVVYKKLAETSHPKPVVIRTLDIGRNHIKDEKTELNPFLGLRSIRYCLMNSGLFKTQLRAILRASHYGYVKIMIPMVTNLEEVHTIKTLIEEVKKELMVEEVFFDEEVEIGVMIEVPSAALIVDLISEDVDFISIGTNDLLQYTLAVDRSSPDVNYLYNPFSLSFLRLLKLIADKIVDKPFYLSGEITSDPLFVIFALGLGIEGISTNIYDIPKIKNLISNISFQECRKIVDTVFQCSDDMEIINILHDFYRDKFPE